MSSDEEDKKDSERKRAPVSQRSKRHEGGGGGSKENASRKKNKKKYPKKCSDESLFSKRQQPPKNDSDDGGGGGSGRQKKNTNNNNSLETKGSGEMLQMKKSAESCDKRSSRRERNKSAEKTESKFQKVKRILSGEKLESPKENHICSEVFGYGPEFNDEWLEDPQTIELKVDPPKKKKIPIVKVSKTLIIYEVPKELANKIEIGDILYKFNDLPLTSRDEYTKQLSFVTKNPDYQTLTFTILRPLKSKPIPEKELADAFSTLGQPYGFELLPTHFDYLAVFLMIAPNTTLGLTIKGFNGKVYVSGIENRVTSIAQRSLLVGDAIFCVDDNIVYGIKMTEDALAQACSKKKFIKLLVERAKNADGIKLVKVALGTEKTVEINPRMGEDIVDICNAQLKMMEDLDETLPKGIYRSKPSKAYKKKHVYVFNESVETPISTDVNNITLLASTPPVPAIRSPKR